MGRVREHDPVIIEELNGLWSRGDDESCPLDHLLKADNIQFFHSGVETRTAVKPYAQVVFTADLRKTKRVYNYMTQTGHTLLVLIEGGKLYHLITPTEIYLILEIPEMEDFAFISIAGRAYISPFKIYTNTSGQKYALGLKDQFVYVYYRDPTVAVGTTVPARIAAGSPPTNASKKPFIGYVSSIAGTVTKGFHVIWVSYNDGVLGPEAPIVVDAPGDKAIELVNIPIGPGGTTSRTIVMTKASTSTTPWAAAMYTALTIPDNVTVSYKLDVTDASLTAVYAPGATPAPLHNGLILENSLTDGFCDLGFHLVGVVYESDTGYLSAPGPEFFAGNTYVDEKKAVKVRNIPISPGSSNVKRHIVSTKTIPEYNGDQKGYQFFFVPKGILENNTATEITISYYDSDLIADASHLIDNFSRIPAGVNFCEYHSRLVLVGDSSRPKKLDGTTEDIKKPDNRSVAWISAPGEPEAINQIDGLVITPLDGNPLTNCQDFRDNLFLFKQNRTYTVTDNGDDPVTWTMEVVDQGIGASVHGIAEVLDSGGVNVDYLIMADWSGLMLFNGTYARPELSWKIEKIWIGWDKNQYHNLQIVNDSIRKKIWILDPHAPTKILYLLDYGNGLNPKDIRWATWWFESTISSIALLKTDQLIIGTIQVT